MKYRIMPWEALIPNMSYIMSQMYRDGFRPDWIVGLPRGGLIPATVLSHLTGIPMLSYDQFQEQAGDARLGPQKFLIVDDINDSGQTLNQVFEDNDIEQDESIDEDDKTDYDIIRTAVLVNNIVSEFPVDYFASEFNKDEQPCWYVFPWETPESTKR